MSGHKRIFWLITLSFFITGCGGFQPAVMSSTDPAENQEIKADERVIDLGDKVRVTMKDKREITGVFVSRDSTSIVIKEGEKNLDDPGRSDIVMHTLLIGEIKTVELYLMNNDSAVLVIIGVVVVVVSVIGLKMKSDFDDGFIK